jgi:hypothetical protein
VAQRPFTSILEEPLPNVSYRKATQAATKAFDAHPGLVDEYPPALGGGSYAEILDGLFYCVGDLWATPDDFDRYAWRCQGFSAFCAAYYETTDEEFLDVSRQFLGLIKRNASAELYARYISESLSWLTGPDPRRCGFN